MVQISIEKEQKQQHMNGIDNIFVKGCTAEDVENYDQKSSGSLEAAPDSIPYILEDSQLVLYPPVRLQCNYDV